MTPWERTLLRLTSALRMQLLDVLGDEDLGVALPGNPPLGDLAEQNGRHQRAYIESFRTRRLDWDVADAPPGVSRDVEALRAWWTAMDEELLAVLDGIPADDFQAATVDRGGGFQMPMPSQFHTWREAILIFCAHADVYLRSLDKHPGEQWEDWIG